MPTYDYRCGACEHEFELFQSMKDSAKKKCPECGKLALERLIGTGAAVLFKGSGFYETDYRSKSYNDAAKKDKEAGAPKADSGADAKPAKAESKPAKPAMPAEKPKARTKRGDD
ncbi:MAG: zinc ribbon domain-containing protein [Phycisphaerales bacterium]|nr:zinc ribbon domain-containing protein [Phycisphaerales bacterium]